jgi:hypothetical protein
MSAWDSLLLKVRRATPRWNTGQKGKAAIGSVCGGRWSSLLKGIYSPAAEVCLHK